MSEAVCEIEEIQAMTIDSLDQSEAALETLQHDCISSGKLLLTDVGQGALNVITAAEQVHDFIIFEQEIINLYALDSEKIVDGERSLGDLESDMNIMLTGFNEKLEAMDLAGISGIMTDQLPTLLGQFKDILPTLREKINDTDEG